MLKNYFKIALRNFSKHRGYTLLNVVGLSIGISACLLILSYVLNELSYDKFNKNAVNIYRIQLNSYQDGKLAFQCAATYPGVGPALKEEFPEVEEYARLFPISGILSYDDINFRETKIFRSDPAVFKIFTLPFVRGNSEKALTQPGSVVISESIAKKYFGNENPLGKILRYNGEEEFTVTGVMKDLPDNSHIKIDLLLSNERLYEYDKELDQNWGWYDFNTYVLLKAGTDPKELQKKLPALVSRREEEEYRNRTELILQPLTNIHLYSNLLQESEVNGNGKTVYFLMVIAIFILLIAWINYINLATARSVERSREVGVRKVLGALKRQLIQQFLFESIILNVISVMFSLIIIEISMPFFNHLTEKSIHLSYTNYEFWLAVFLFFLLGSFISAIYPSLVLSSFIPQKVLKGSFKRSENGISFRKALVVFQFAVSIALIAGTLIVYNQVEFMKSQKLGVNIDQTLVVRSPKVASSDSVRSELVKTFKNKIKSFSQIKSVTASTNIPGDEIFWATGSYVKGKDESPKTIYLIATDYDYFDSYDIHFVAGRNFSRSFSTDLEYGGIINEEALKLYDFSSPEQALNKFIMLNRDSIKVIGVVKNYHQMSLDKIQNPMLFVLNNRRTSYISVKINPVEVEKTVDEIREEYAQLFPGNPFEFFFLDEFYNKQYQSEIQFGNIFGVFSILAIIVAGIGLFGLSSFSAIQKTKEIGIRKVLGASVPSIVSMLSKEYMILVVVANLIAWPAAYYIMNKWLENFAYKTNVGVGVFLTAGLLVLVIALLTVSFQAIKVATANPVKSLRYE